jgi:tRNA pseudouridine38-40 synthase
MPHWKLILSYDGTAFHGWQVQPDRPTIQGALSAALAHVAGESVLPQGSGRTDAGVHALAQVTTFSLSVPIPSENLYRALNRALPPSIRVLSTEEVPETFHARHSAVRKSYEYRIFSPTGSRAVCSPFLAPYMWDCRWALALEPMQQAAAMLLGTHDFTSFAACDADLTTRSERRSPLGTTTKEMTSKEITSDKDDEIAETSAGPSPVKALFVSTIERESELLIYRVTGSGFLHHMVRNLVGTLVDIGRGALSPDDMLRILAARDRTAAGPTAPPQGLFLVRVEYPEGSA